MKRDVLKGDGSGKAGGIVEEREKKRKRKEKEGRKGKEKEKEYVRMYAPYITPFFKACVSNAQSSLFLFCAAARW